jgi:hypothetical protein
MGETLRSEILGTAGLAVAAAAALFLTLSRRPAAGTGSAEGAAVRRATNAARGYFPGLLTSPLVGIAGLLLWRELIAITQSGRLARAGQTPASSSRPSP